MAKKKPTTEIEEAVIVEETTSVAILTADYTAPVLSPTIKKDESLATIQKTFDKYKDVEIADTKDKANYELVATGMKEFKDTRIAYVKAVNQNLLDPVKDWLAGEKESLDAIVDKLKEGESTLRSKKDAIDQKKKDEKAEAERLKLERMTGRIEALVKIGGKSSGAKYVFDHDLTLSFSTADIKDLEDDKWEAKLAEATKAWDAEQERIEEKRKADQKLIDDANALAEANLVNRTRIRLKELKFEGFTQEGRTWVKNGKIYFGEEDVEQAPDYAWDATIQQASADEEEEAATAIETAPETVDTDDESLPFDEDDTELPFGDTEGLSNPISGTDRFGSLMEAADLIENVLEEEFPTPAEEPVITEVVLSFSLEQPFLIVPITAKLSQVIFTPDLRDVALEGFEIATEGQITTELHFALVKR